MASFVNFIKQKKVDMKFSRAGEGHRLNEEKKPTQLPKVVQEQRKPQTCAGMVAGAAALQRQQSTGSSGRGKEAPANAVKPKLGMSAMTDKDKQSSFHGVGHHLTDNAQNNDSRNSEPHQYSSSTEVLMVCPVCKESVAHATVTDHLHHCLQEEYLKEPLTASVQMIHTLAESEQRSATCVNTILRYIDNVISHPGEEKYRKIRSNNKAFKERVESVVGGVLFLEAVGFTQRLLPHEDGEEQFYVLSEAKALCTDDLMAWKDILTSVQKLEPALDRNPQLLVPSGNIEQFDLPNEFYNFSIEEIRREQKTRTEAIEHSSVLRTKAMREKDELKAAIKYYRFILLRIRFPEDVILQGVFKPMEPLGAVRQFISDCLLDPSRQYKLSFMRTQLCENTDRLAQLGLAPAALLSLQWNGGEEYLGFPVEQIFKPAVYTTLKI